MIQAEIDPNYIDGLKPSLRVIRPVVETLDGVSQQLKSDCAEQGLSQKSLQFYLRTGAYVVLLGASEVVNMQKAIGVESTVEARDELGDYLEAELDPGFDEDVILSLRPADFFVRRRQPPLTNKFSHTIFRSAVSPQLEQERATIKNLMYEYYEVTDPASVYPEDIWDFNDAVLLKIAGTWNPDKTYPLGHVLATSKALPDTLTLEGIDIQDTKI